MFSECRNFPELGQFYYDEVISRGYRLIELVVRRGMDSGELRPMDAEYVTRLVIAPVVLMAIWRHSFDFCDSHRLDSRRYIDHHVELLLNGLIAGTASSCRAATARAPEAPRRRSETRGKFGAQCIARTP